MILAVYLPSPDLVCQSGPGSWPSRIYAQTAKYPMANSVAQVLLSELPYKLLKWVT